MAATVLLTPDFASSSAISMEYSLGFNGHFQLKKWTPLTVILENRGRALSGRIEVIVTSGSEYRRDVHQTTHTMNVDLPYNSIKRYPFTIRIDSFTHEMIIRLKQEKKTIMTRSVNLRSHYTTQPLGIVVRRKISPDLLSELPKNIFPATVRPRFLPHIWYGYDGVKVLIISAEMVMYLSEKQFQALEEWIKNGGYLITTSGINYGALLEKRISRLLPIKILGHHQFLELPALSAFCNHPFTSPDPFLVLNARIENSEILLRENNIPIIFQRNIVIGKILFLSFDFFNPPFSRWAHKRSFWDQLLSIGPTPFGKEIDLESRTIQNALLSKMPVAFPNFKQIFAFLVFYVFLIGLYYHKAKHRIDNNLKYGGYLVIFIAVITVISYMAFFFPHNRKNLTHNSFALIKYFGQNNIAFIKQVVGLYALTETPYDVRFGSTLAPVTHLMTENQRKEIPNTYLFHDDNFGQRITGQADKWSSNFFVIDSKIPFPGIADGFEEDHGLGILIKNKLSHNILDSWGYMDGRYFLFGDILSNTTETKRIRSSERVNKETIEHRMKRRFGDLAKEIVNAVHLNYQSRKNTVCLVGWIPQSLIKVDVAKSHDIGKSLSLLQWEIPVKTKDEI